LNVENEISDLNRRFRVAIPVFIFNVQSTPSITPALIAERWLTGKIVIFSDIRPKPLISLFLLPGEKQVPDDRLQFPFSNENRACFSSYD
jgi:hypothetical protein